MAIFNSYVKLPEGKQSSLFANVATSLSILSRTDLMFRTGGARMSGRTFGGSLNLKRCETMWTSTIHDYLSLSITIYHYLSLSRYYQDTIISVVQWCSFWFRDVLWFQRKPARTESADLHDLDRFRQCLLHSVRASTQGCNRHCAFECRLNVHKVTSQCDFTVSKCIQCVLTMRSYAICSSRNLEATFGHSGRESCASAKVAFMYSITVYYIYIYYNIYIYVRI